MSENIYETDAYARQVETSVVDVDDEANAVLLEQTVFYPGGGGQPADEGRLAGDGGGDWRVIGAKAFTWKTNPSGTAPAHFATVSGGCSSRARASACVISSSQSSSTSIGRALGVGKAPTMPARQAATTSCGPDTRNIGGDIDHEARRYRRRAE